MSSYISYFILSVISSFFTLLSFAKLTNNRFNYSIKNFIILFIVGIFITINFYVSEGLIKIVISYLILYFASLLIYKDNNIKSVIYMLFCYSLLLFYEIVLSIIVMKISDIEAFDNNTIAKICFSLINVLLVYYTCKINKIKLFANSFYKKINIKFLLVVFVLLFISLVIIDFKYIMTFSANVYISNLVLLICVISLAIINFVNNYSVKKEIEKTETLLNYMNKYEKIIDDDRFNRHEMLNNLLILKSFNNKNSKEYNDTLDELITTYNKKGIGIKNIYNLPTGLKGIFYYKIHGLDEKGINVNINISKNITNSFKSIDHKDYVLLYKIIGIILDNAIEASLVSKDKYLGVDIYKEKSNIIINVDNSFKGKIDINRIYDKGYSNKGKNRGLGLMIVSNLLKNNNSIILEQVINNNIFNSKITIKKDK